MSPRKPRLLFSPQPEGPPPAEATVERRVRFEEVDPLGIVWHGRYPSYLEDGRTAFGDRFQLGYLDLHRNGCLAPLVQMQIDYFHSLEFDEEFTIHTRLHWSEAVRLNFEYRLTNKQGDLVATASTVQVLMDFDRQLILVWPAFLEDFFERWRAGQLT